MFELEAYERTRSVGLPWRHHIPEHWRIARAKSVMSAIDVRSATGEEELLTVSSSRGVIPRSSASVSMFKAESYVGHKLCWPGDLVINSLWAWGRGLGVARDHGIVSTAYGVYRQREHAWDPAYLDHLVRSEPFRWELQVRSQGVWKSRLQMTDARWLDAPLLIPPADEQAAIVKYLAHANARIDKAIAAKRRLIALLEEQGGALLHDLIRARGEQWPVRRLKTLLRGVDQGVSPQAESQVPQASEWGVLKAGCVNGGRFREDQVKRLPAEFEVPEEYAIQAGDVLVSRASGSPHLVGSTARVPANPPRAILSDKTFRLRLHDEVDPDFLVLLMNARAYRDQVRLAISGAEGLANNLPISSLRTFAFGVPALSDQLKIVKEVAMESAVLRTTSTRLEHEVGLLQEFRTRLVADVVTGQVDVRDVAGPLAEPDVEAAASVDDSEIDDLMETSEV